MSVLKGKTFLISNRTPREDVNGISSFVKANGGKIKSRIDRKCHFLIRTF